MQSTLVTSNVPTSVGSINPESRFIVHTMDGKEFVLNGKQVQILKDASIRGNVGLVWFGDFAINMSRIESVERKGSPYKKWEVPEYLLNS